jgi:hypothetical protein
VAGSSSGEAGGTDAQQQQQQQRQEQREQQGRPAGGAPPVAPTVDAAKGAVVFRRYYHLFALGELEVLVGALGPTAAVVDSFYDRDNWCCVFQRSEG